MCRVHEPWDLPGASVLFCPADRPDRFAKASADADAVILDLEDGVAARDKPAARAALKRMPLDPSTTIVRINAAGTDEQRGDLEAIAGTAYNVVMLAKAESVEQIAALSPLRVIPLIETPRGVLAADGIAAAGAVAMMWGAEDLVAGLGGRSSRDVDGRFRSVAEHARSVVLLAAAANGISAIDTVFLDINDLDGIAAQAKDAVALGFAALACIHPSQVSVVRDAFRPTTEEIAWARRVLAAAVDAPGVFALDGQMVDAPVLRHARRVLDRSG
jgi:citrate lyase subunit beta/citryl-CoA lyase